MSNKPVSTTARPVSQPVSRSTLRRVTTAAAVGNTVETYDFAVFGFLATILAVNFFPDSQPGAALLSTFAVFGVAFVARPLGGFVFGPLADRIGRQRTLVVTLVLMAIVTPMIGLLPTAASIGFWAPVLLVALRLLQGLAAGGEFTSAVVYAAEFSPQRMRGRMTSRVQIGSLVGLLIAAVVVLGSNVALSAEQMSLWGWRIPFLLALPLGLVGLYLRHRLGETPEFVAVEDAGERVSRPVREAFAHHWALMVLIFAIAALHLISFYMVYTYSQTYIIALGNTRTEASLVVVLALVWSIALMVVGGRLADVVGRWPMLMGVSLATLVLAFPVFDGMSDASSLGDVVVYTLILAAVPALYTAVTPVTYVELCPPQVRATVFGVGYGIAAAVFGGGVLYATQVLVDITEDNRAPAFVLMAAAAVAVVASLAVRRRYQRG